MNKQKFINYIYEPLLNFLNDEGKIVFLRYTSKLSLTPPPLSLSFSI